MNTFSVFVDNATFDRQTFVRTSQTKLFVDRVVRPLLVVSLGTIINLHASTVLVGLGCIHIQTLARTEKLDLPGIWEVFPLLTLLSVAIPDLEFAAIGVVLGRLHFQTFVGTKLEGIHNRDSLT